LLEEPEEIMTSRRRRTRQKKGTRLRQKVLGKAAVSKERQSRQD
jgi:hypothetical protein